jgi:diacylglycerol O-acyltransferase / wax synthase
VTTSVVVGSPVEVTRTAETVDRLTADDLVALATDVGPAPMQVGAVLVLDPPSPLDPAAVFAAVEDRIRGVPRLRRRLVTTPPGCGRPVWVDDAHFDLQYHVRTRTCPGAGTEADLLAVATEVITTALPHDRPLWRLTFVTGLSHDRAALIVAFHHVLADGIGGLAVLANLVDGAAISADCMFPRPAPTRSRLVLDTARSRLDSLRRFRGARRRIREALIELRPVSASVTAPSSLNRPTGSRRRLRVVRTDLRAIHRSAHEHDATVNDIVLTAVAAALHRLLLSRGEHVDRFVVSIPVSTRRAGSADHLGNEVRPVPVDLPADGSWGERLREVAVATRTAKQTTRAASVAVLGPVFRLLAWLRIFRWFINRQRLVHTFVTNLRGPETQLTFLGAPITQMLPVAVVTGNVTVSFAVLSYAGTLAVTVIADPDACPDLDLLTDELRSELELARTT